MRFQTATGIQAALIDIKNINPFGYDVAFGPATASFLQEFIVPQLTQLISDFSLTNVQFFGLPNALHGGSSSAAGSGGGSNSDSRIWHSCNATPAFVYRNGSYPIPAEAVVPDSGTGRYVFAVV